MSQVCEPTPFPCLHIASIPPAPPDRRWLVESLWSVEGVGLIGGQHKCYKTWLMAELALSVATGAPAFGRFPVPTPGPVLVFAAEDQPPEMRLRFDALALARDLSLQQAPIHIIDITSLCLNDPHQLQRLQATVHAIKPVLLVLDPFIRIATIDENSAQEVSALLGSLRALQRSFHLAIILVHHMRKSSSIHPSLQLRGTSDFAAWSDSALYLTRTNDDDCRRLTVQHRAAQAPDPFTIRFLADNPSPHLAIDDHQPTPQTDANSLELAILKLLHSSPLTTVYLRDHFKLRKATIVATLNALEQRGLILRSDHGWQCVGQ